MGFWIGLVFVARFLMWSGLLGRSCWSHGVHQIDDLRATEGRGVRTKMAADRIPWERAQWTRPSLTRRVLARSTVSSAVILLEGLCDLQSAQHGL